MKKIIFCMIMLILPIYLLSCSPGQKADEDEMVAMVNDCPLTLGECQCQMAAVVNLNEDYKLTKEAKKAFLEELVRKELLIQEAKRLQVDRKEKFIRTIERYWESTLIRNLMEIKGEELTKRILVSQEEIEASYNAMKRPGEKLPPLENLREDIIQRIGEEKKTRMLSEWMDDLRKAAKVEIKEELLCD